MSNPIKKQQKLLAFAHEHKDKEVIVNLPNSIIKEKGHITGKIDGKYIEVASDKIKFFGDTEGTVNIILATPEMITFPK